VQEKTVVAFLLTNWSQTWYSTSKVDIGTITQNSLHRPWGIRLARLFTLWANEIGMTDCIAVSHAMNRFTPSPSFCLIGRTPVRSCCTQRRNLYQPLRPPTVFQCTIPKLLLSLWCRFHQQLRHRSLHHLGIDTVPTQRTPQLDCPSALTAQITLRRKHDAETYKSHDQHQFTTNLNTDIARASFNLRELVGNFQVQSSEHTTNVAWTPVVVCSKACTDQCSHPA